jgi:methylase of polypeptide subunit release factors
VSVAADRNVGELWLSDINPAALTLAAANAIHAGQSAFFVKSDLFATLDGAFDLILANPPYLADPAKRAYRDGGGSLGMALGLRIVREGIERLAPNGVLFLYTGAPVADGVDQFRLGVEQIIPADRFSFDYSEIDPDVFGEELDMPTYRRIDRIAVTALIITDLRARWPLH